jgi:hypothetical protein
MKLGNERKGRRIKGGQGKVHSKVVRGKGDRNRKVGFRERNKNKRKYKIKEYKKEGKEKRKGEIEEERTFAAEGELDGVDLRLVEAFVKGSEVDRSNRLRLCSFTEK